MNYHFQYKGISVYYVENMGTVAEAAREVKPQIFNTVPRLLEKIYDNILAKGKDLSWFRKTIFFWAVSLGLRYRLHNNSAFYRFRLKIAGKLVFSKWRAALGGEVQVVVSGGAALQSRLEKIFWAAGIPVIRLRTYRDIAGYCRESFSGSLRLDLVLLALFLKMLRSELLMMERYYAGVSM